MPFVAFAIAAAAIIALFVLLSISNRRYEARAIAKQNDAIRHLCWKAWNAGYEAAERDFRPDAVGYTDNPFEKEEP